MYPPTKKNNDQYPTMLSLQLSMLNTLRSLKFEYLISDFSYVIFSWGFVVYRFFLIIKTTKHSALMERWPSS